MELQLCLLSQRPSQSSPQAPGRARCAWLGPALHHTPLGPPGRRWMACVDQYDWSPDGGATVTACPISGLLVLPTAGAMTDTPRLEPARVPSLLGRGVLRAKYMAVHGAAQHQRLTQLGSAPQHSSSLSCFTSRPYCPMQWASLLITLLAVLTEGKC